MSEASELLDDVDALRRKARRDGRGNAFPLLLFGALILVAPLCYRENDPPPPGKWALVDKGPFPLFGSGMFSDLRYPSLVGWYWVLAIVVGLAATVWWYRRRAQQVGLEIDTRKQLGVVGAAVAGFLLGVPLLTSFVDTPTTLYSTPEINLPILFGAGLLSALVLYWSLRPHRTAGPRAAGLFVGLFLASTAFAALGIYLRFGFAALLVIAMAVLTLAWLERSLLVAVVGIQFAAAALLVNLGVLASWNADHRIVVLGSLALPALILIVGGVLAAVTERAGRR
ncbi:hypothetical protein EV193_111186 [Herbihabitans rhizosphaerae]|uniref:Uncharacterized protein n=1 Tax=Herbihabitans rhizosphaerae TaxID=1872711 RepID=A0A4Q7KFB2_9PSEU|nr:hypothetical protein [Herbihabitans rhizosphaerae]RZS32801.1 hypothetical protein EV193_111186 [Herbihabitans rhizosphaerae]